MVKPLFPNFLEDPRVYAACERYWEKVVHDITDSLGQAGEWQSWISGEYADGTPMDLKGNPMFSARSLSQNRAFQIIQDKAEGDGVEISAWLKEYDEEYEELPADELVIYLSLSDESAKIAHVLLQAWMTPTTTAAAMALLISQAAPSDSTIVPRGKPGDPDNPDQS